MTRRAIVVAVAGAVLVLAALFGLGISWVVGELEQRTEDIAVLSDQVQSLGGEPKAGPSQGEPGAQGVQGDRGPEGDRGPAGRDGADGESPPCLLTPTRCVGPRGPAGADGVDGQNGAVGPVGPQGDQGPAGPSCPSGYTLEPDKIQGREVLVCTRN